jgi:polygalacturonase
MEMTRRGFLRGLLATTAVVAVAPQAELLAKAAQEIKQKFINVRDYGALGDSLTDDTLAIQRALDAARDNGTDGKVYFPAGTYRITDTLWL